MKNVKLGALMCGDEFVPRCETYKVKSAFMGIVVCENVKTGRLRICAGIILWIQKLYSLSPAANIRPSLWLWSGTDTDQRSCTATHRSDSCRH